MNLEIIKLQTTWNDAAGSINSNYAKIADAIAQLKANGGGGGISELTSKMVVDALGYTPYNATNPANYITTEDLVENYASKSDLESAINDIDLSAYLLKADLTKSRIQSTLGISDWALASAKPTYTASEVGALSVSKELYSGSLNDYTTAGIYRFNSISDGSERMSPYGNLLVVRGGTHDTLAQLYFNYYDGKAFIRSSNTSGLSSANWNTIAFTSDIPTKLSQLTDDVVAGRYLPLSGGTLNGSITATSFIGNLTGNADSATKLATHCKLWGQRFDGTGDVSGTFRQLYTGSYDGAVAHSILCNINGPYGLITRINGNGDVLQQSQRENTEVEWFNFILQPFGGNVGIGNTSPTERLDVSGNIKASGNINATSITINGVTLTASNGTITVNGNMAATGAVTAGA